MCFSAAASLTAGAGLLIVGAITVRQAQSRAEMPFAAIPVLFGIQQLLEGALWLTFAENAPQSRFVLTHAYSFFSHVLWPIYVPLAVLCLEPEMWRRKVLVGISLAGAIVGLYLLYFLIKLPIVAQVQGRHIVYISSHFYILVVMLLYVLGTCISSVYSSHGWVRVFGIVSFLSFVTAAAFYERWFISVWCFFAALLSSIVLMFFLDRQKWPSLASSVMTKIRQNDA